MLRLYQSNRLEILAQRLGQLMAVPVSTPLQPEILVVQHPGMARWLALQIAEQQGICANVRFPLPGAFIWEMVGAFLQTMPETNQFAPSLLRWRIFDRLKQLDDQADFFPLKHYLASEDEARRFQLAERLGELFDRYLVYRPDWIILWEAGEQAQEGDAWQAALWRQLISDQGSHWVRLQQALFDYSGERPTGLPCRLFLFGVPTLSPGYLQILQWLGQWTDIHLLLLNPCETHWADIVDRQTLVREALKAGGAELYLELGNPLLASLGRQGRDFFAAINEMDPGSEESFVDPGEDCLLHRLQQQVLRLEQPESLELTPDDSIKFHLYHSPMREVEGLYDQLLEMFEKRPDLTPADVLVMTPDIETYAPLIEAIFGVPDDRPPIPFGISDLAPSGRNSIVSAFLELLEMPASRYGVNSLLRFLEVPAIQQRFGLDEIALEAVTEWIDAAHIRWGRDGPSKSTFNLPNEPANTWRAGLEQLLLGFAMPAQSQELWRGIAPLGVVEGSDAQWLAGLLEFCESLFGLEEQLCVAHDLRAWGELLSKLLDDFFHADPAAELPLQQLRGGIRQLLEEGIGAGYTGTLNLPLLRQLLRQIFSRPSTQGFLAGGVSFCALAPMRSLPFRVICLIGMNEDSFPRQAPQLGFDLMSRQFRFGDRSRRADDRYLFLETLISARQSLYISHVGRNIRDNSPLPPSVLVDELRDYLRAQIGEEGLSRLTRIHPLQSFSRDYFLPEKGLVCYSSRLHEAATLVGQGDAQPSPLLTQPLDESGSAVDQLNLVQLVDFFTNPARVFAQQRLILQLEAGSAQLEEREPFEMERYLAEELVTELVERLMAGHSSEDFFQLLRVRGVLPQGKTGEHHFQRLLVSARQLHERLKGLQLGDPLPVVDFDLPIAEAVLVGRLQGLYPTGQVSFTPGRYHPHRMLKLWIRHLVVSILQPPGVSRTARWLEQDGAGGFREVEDAQAILEQMLLLYRRGLRVPLHFYPGSSWAYAQNLLLKQDPIAAEKAAASKWFGSNYFPGEFAKPYQRLLLPAEAMLDEEFRATSLAVFRPLIDHLELIR